MKIAVLLTAIAGIALAGCLPGQRLGNFKNWCASENGLLEEVSPNNYKCTVGDKIHYSK
jgi:hypothetical protein